MRVDTTFSEVPEGMTFYVLPYPDAPESEAIAIKKIKSKDGNSYCDEWGAGEMPGPAPCWYFTKQ